MPELPYVALYPEAMLFLARSGDCDALTILLVLCEHADGFGGCDPGDERLGKRSGHRRDAIPAILARLQAVEYIRIIETTVPYRQKPLRGFKINPYVIRLRSENHASAVADWQRFDPQTNGGNEKQTTSITFPVNDQQPDQNQNQLYNPLQKQPQKPPPNLRKPSASADQKPPEAEGQNPDEEETHDGTETPRESGRTASDSAPFRREARDLVRFRLALADEASEEMALELVSLAPDLSRENARMLVSTYGWEQSARVSKLYRFHNGTVRQPGRWIRAMLRKLDGESQRGQGT